MRIERCSDQLPETLEAFYRSNDRPRGAGPAMLELLGRLRALPDQRELWGLTSHARLVLLVEDTARSPWRVIISALGVNSYQVEYLMPDSEAPWPGALVQGEGHSVEEAVQMTLTALERSGAVEKRQ